MKASTKVFILLYIILIILIITYPFMPRLRAVCIVALWITFANEMYLIMKGV